MKWKPIPSYDGLYEVSDTGLVRSLDRKIITSNGQVRRYKGKVFDLNLDKRGYPRASLSSAGKTKKVFVHQLVALVFLGKPPKGYEVCHNDGNKLNCNKNNLRYDTHKENIGDRRYHNTDNKGIRNGKAKITEKEVKLIRKQAKNKPAAKLAKIFGLHEKHIIRIIRHKSWKHIP